MHDQKLKLKDRTGTGRIFVLDAMRGLAATTVVLHHLLISNALYPLTLHSYWKPFTAGHEAVILFFVLSGYVLSLPVWRDRQLPYGAYLIRRVTRIYLPFAAAVGFSALVGRHFLYSQLQLGPWFHQTWQEPIGWRLIGENLAMKPVPSLNTAFWSLRYEMEMSVVFPALCAVIKLAKTRYTLVAMVAAYCLGDYIFRHRADTFYEGEALRYSVCFIAGALLAMHREKLQTAWDRASDPAKWTLLAMSSLLYLRFLDTAHGRLADLLRLNKSADIDRDFVILAGTVGLVLAATCSRRIQAALDREVFDYLGRVSYSLYLVHGTVLFAIVNLLYGRVGKLTLMAAYLVTAFMVAHLFLLLFEEPFLRLGRRLTAGAAEQARVAARAGVR